MSHYHAEPPGARRLALAMIEQTYYDAAGPCSGERTWCVRFDALRAARGTWLVELADVLGLSAVIDAVAKMPDCPVSHPPWCCATMRARRSVVAVATRRVA